MESGSSVSAVANGQQSTPGFEETTMRRDWRKIRKMADTVGILPFNGENPATLKQRTRLCYIILCLETAPIGSQEHGNGLLYTHRRALELAPDGVGKRLALRFEQECESRFAKGVGIYTAQWQWMPEVYKDENGTPNLLALHGDGFPLVKIRLGTDGVWRWDWALGPERVNPARPVYPVAVSMCVREHLLEALGLPADTDPATLIGQPVDEDTFIKAVKLPRIEAGEWSLGE